MQDLSFRWDHPRYPSAVGPVSVRVHTADNVYGLDPQATTVDEDETGRTIRCERLAWAGGQQTAPGSVRMRLTDHGGRTRITVTAEHPDGVRCVAVVLHDQPTGAFTGLREGDLDVPDTGRIVEYPNGWFDLATPLLGLRRPDGTVTVATSLDRKVHSRRFVAVPHFDDPSSCDLELITDSIAASSSRTFDVPPWELTRVDDIETEIARHSADVRSVHQLPRWEERTDVPDWFRRTSLIVTLHGMHFTGRVFLDYPDMLRALQRLSEQIDPARVLAYLPGWEGRYYRWYGRYAPEPRLGGTDGFRTLIGGAHELGVRVMPMFGSNIASRDLPGFEHWAGPGELLSASGHASSGSVDWDASRHYDHGWGAIINPSYRPWRRHLVEQIVGLQREYCFDAAFLDITAAYSNDPRGSTTEGLRALVDELRADCPDLLITGEGWFDAIGGIVPVTQIGHRDTVPTFHDLPTEDLFTTTNRSFGHLCLGDPAHGSTGCHEAGFNQHWRLPLRHGVIPTLNLVDDTLDAAPDRVALIVQDAHEYAAKYLD